MNPHNTPNASLQQHSRPTMPFRLMAVLHCLRTRELLVKLLRIRWLGQPMAENRDGLAKKYAEVLGKVFGRAVEAKAR